MDCDRTEKAWEHFDAAFAEMDKAIDAAFAKADKQHTVKEIPATTVNFTANDAKERWRIFRKFFKMSLAVLFTGKTQLRIKQK